MSRELKRVKLCDVVGDKFDVRLEVGDDGFEDLVASIRRDGVLVPVLLVDAVEGFTVVAGHRRCAAARRAGLDEVPAMVVGAEEGLGWRGSFAENMFREDLSPLEQAAAVGDALASGDFDVDSLAAAVGRSRDWVDGRLVILSWPVDVQQAVHKGGLSLGGGFQLAQITDEAQRLMFINYAIENGASVRTCAAWLQSWRAGGGGADGGEVVPAEPVVRTPPAELMTECVLCGEAKRCVELSYQPVCGECGNTLVTIGEQLRHGGGVGGGR